TLSLARKSVKASNIAIRKKRWTFRTHPWKIKELEREMASLLITSDGFGNQVIRLKLGVTRVGRTSKNDVQLEHATISAQHCQFLLSHDGLTVRDCDSTNGTFLADERI